MGTPWLTPPAPPPPLLPLPPVLRALPAGAEGPDGGGPGRGAPPPGVLDCVESAAAAADGAASKDFREGEAWGMGPVLLCAGPRGRGRERQKGGGGVPNQFAGSGAGRITRTSRAGGRLARPLGLSRHLKRIPEDVSAGDEDAGVWGGA